LRQDLIDRIDQLGGEDAAPVIPLDLFFEGNDDEASFAPNLEPHPGIGTIYAVLGSIKEREEVANVIVQIDEVLPEPEWPYASAVYVLTSAPAARVHEWAAAIEPDELPGDDADAYGWLEYGGRRRDAPPPGAPELPGGYRPVVLFWD
jgi:hypothetical protein